MSAARASSVPGGPDGFSFGSVIAVSGLLLLGTLAAYVRAMAAWKTAARLDAQAHPSPE